MPFKHCTLWGTTSLCISFWVSALSLQTKPRYHGPPIVTSKVLKFRESFPNHLYVLLSVNYFALVQSFKVIRMIIFEFFMLTGYIPKAWICKTLNLHLNRSVWILFLYMIKQVLLFCFAYPVAQFSLIYLFWSADWMCLCWISSSVHPLDNIAGLLDLSLLYHLWISASFLLFTWHITLLLFRIFVTEVCVKIGH